MRNRLRRGPTQMMMEIFYDRIRTSTHNNNKNWHCTRCKKNYANENQILKHMNKEHNEITRGAIHCPFCNKQWPRIMHAKQHVMTGNCTKQPPHLNGPHLWNYIVKRNPPHIYRRNVCKRIRNGPVRKIQLQDNWANEQDNKDKYAGIPRNSIPTHRITHKSPYGPTIITNRITRVNSNPQTQNYDTHQPLRQNHINTPQHMPPTPPTSTNEHNPTHVNYTSNNNNKKENQKNSQKLPANQPPDQLQKK